MRTTPSPRSSTRRTISSATPDTTCTPGPGPLRRLWPSCTGRTSSTETSSQTSAVECAVLNVPVELVCSLSLLLPCVCVGVGGCGWVGVCVCVWVGGCGWVGVCVSVCLWVSVCMCVVHVDVDEFCMYVHNCVSLSVCTAWCFLETVTT